MVTKSTLDIRTTTQPDAIESVADAVLFEGFLLYPYRLSSLKNRQRWNFGVLYPPSYCSTQSGGETSMMQTECLLDADAQTILTVKVRFLHHSMDATYKREVCTDALKIDSLAASSWQCSFSFPPVHGQLEVSATELMPGIFKVSVRILNLSDFQTGDRDQALSASLISTHSILSVQHGAFHSLIDPPQSLSMAKEQCRNIGAWPVLAGPEGKRDRILSAPIILYDYPKISPQSPGDLFDAAEIDEILTLRILTLTDDERLQMQQADQRTRQLLQRTESLSDDQLRNLHGALYRKSTLPTGLKVGDRVRIQPRRRADIFDIALTGRTATVCSLEQDFEENAYVCVTVDDDPGRDLGREARPGHRFFFGLDEVEKL